MKRLSKLLTLGSYLFISSTVGLASQFDDGKTKELDEYLSGIVMTFNLTKTGPVRDDLAQTIEELIKNGANPNIQNSENGTCAIHFAAEAGCVGLIEFLIGRGVQVNARSKEGATALGYAALEDGKEAVLWLLKNGAEVNVFDRDGWTPLIFAASRGNKVALIALLESGADIERASCDARTALSLSAEKDHRDVVYELLTFGANDAGRVFKVSKNHEMLKTCFSTETELPDERPLYQALRLSDNDLLTGLLATLVDILNPNGLEYLINQPNCEGLTLLDIAFIKRNQKAILLFINNGGDPLAGKINGLRLASRIKEWQTPISSDSKSRCLSEMIYAVPQLKYLAILNSSPLFVALPKEVRLRIIRWILAPWAIGD